VEACPVGNNQVNAIIEMRRHLVQVESKMSPELQGAFTKMENNSNPWGVGAHTRADWAEGLGVKTMAEDSNVDLLYWVGCAGAFDERNKSITKSFVNILQKAEVNFGILGTEEGCSGDSARRGGNEYLYQTLAQQNVDTMNGYNVKKIVTACPHCYNTIKNEYPQFGGNFEVYHHSEYINMLAKEKKIDVKVADDANSGKFTYHDSCYLGRYNDNYENPRDLVKKVSGGKLVEAVDNKTKGLCCGAGGAQMWMEEQNNNRVNIKRTKQLVDTGATTIATACPFCITMITDGVKAEEKTDMVKVKDIAELVAENLA
jgi:Fe-S oxidoreductase